MTNKQEKKALELLRRKAIADTSAFLTLRLAKAKEIADIDKDVKESPDTHSPAFISDKHSPNPYFLILVGQAVDIVLVILGLK